MHGYQRTLLHLRCLELQKQETFGQKAATIERPQRIRGGKKET